METVYEGTWEEVAAHGPDLAGRRVRLVVEDEAAAIRERVARLERGIAAIKEIGRGKGPYPNVVVDNDFLYPNEAGLTDAEGV